MKRKLLAIAALLCFALLFVPGLFAPEHLADGESLDAWLGFGSPGSLFGTDRAGYPLSRYAMQGAAVVAGPSLVAGLVVAFFGVLGGVLACLEMPRLEAAVQAFGELVGALPRMVVVLVVALLLPKESRSLLPIALTWALLSAPGAMDEAAAVAGRLGGARFVEALRAHGFSAFRIYLFHIVGLNLRPVVVRQGVDTLVQVVFLELGLSYLAVQDSEPSFTHGDSTRSWADLLYMGYGYFLEVPSGHALVLGLGLVGVVAVMGVLVNRAARAR
ncbi:MAG: hypothetical protein VX899_00250 [Myxococcota bacterium]|nr:hypothetical protein [Myxococcota bacterium]